jgi:hypothetical protein
VRTTVAAAVAALALGLAGCSDSGQPSPPPTPDQPTTTSSPADTSPTTEAAPTTEAPSETASTNLPPEATEDSEAGAEAFALHYIELINQTGQNPERGVLEPLADETCKTCKNFAGNVEYLITNGLHNDGPAARVHDARAVDLGSTTNVEVTFDQLQVDVVDADGEVSHSYELEENVTFVFRLAYRDGWVIQEIRVAE